MYKHIPVLGIVFLVILSTVSSMAISFDSIITRDDKLERMLDDLRFLCTDPSDFNSIKYEYYKEQVLDMYSFDSGKDDVVIEPDGHELTLQVEPLSYPIVSSDGSMNSAWPMKCHDLHHTGLSPYSTADNPYDEKWRFKTYSAEDTPVIADDGTIYFGGGFKAVPYIIAVNPDGAEKWRYKTNGLILGSSPAIAEDGTVYVGSWDWFLYALNPNGTLKWRFSTNNGNIASSPAIAEDGTIYFGDLGDFGYHSKIWAVNPNGTEKWHYTIDDRIYSDSCIGDDGTIYIGSNDNYLYAMNPDGTLKWRFKTGKEVAGSASIASDGTIYAYGTWDNYLYALYPDNGTVKWKCNIKCNSNPSIDSDGIIYVGGNEELNAVYPNGTKKWTFDLGNERWIGGSYPAISADGTIYVAASIGSPSAGGDFFAVNPDGTLRWRKKIADEWAKSSPSIAEDGTVYVGAHNYGDDSYLYAFGRADLTADADGPYYRLIDEPIQFSGSSYGGYLPHTYHWEFGDTFTSEEQNPTHTYTNPANYNVILTVTDNKSNTAIDTTYAWIQTTNTAPDKPTINGPTNGNVGITYDYTFIATDPDDSIIYLYVDWGDNTNTGWKGPYDSGQQVTLDHKWTYKDIFTIKAKAKDPYNTEGPWETLDVTIPRDKSTNNILLWKLSEQFPILQKLMLYLIKLI